MSNIVPFNEMQQMATSVAKSGMFNLKSVEQATTLMLIAQAEGIAPIQAVQMYSVINGMPALKTTEMIARYMRSGGKIVWLETTAKVAKAKFVFDDNELVYEYTIEDANLAGLTGKDNWKRMPKEMLRARCASSGIRMSNPACLNNMYSVEELRDSTDVDIVPVAKSLPEPAQEAEFELVPEPSISSLKLKLASTLKRTYSFSDGDIRDFAAKFDLANDKELLERAVMDGQVLAGLVEEFENGEK